MVGMRPSLHISRMGTLFNLTKEWTAIMRVANGWGSEDRQEHRGAKSRRCGRPIREWRYEPNPCDGSTCTWSTQPLANATNGGVDIELVRHKN